MTDSVKKKIEDIILENSSSYVNPIINNNADLIDDLGVDSISLITIIVEIESTFNIEFPDDLLIINKIRNFNHLVQTVKSIIEREK